MGLMIGLGADHSDWVHGQDARCATRTEPWQIGRMFTYDVTVTGPMGFQVSLARPYPHDTSLIGDFCSLQEAEAFADKMREIDAGPSYITPLFDPED
jgi:hypothetical protein